MADTTGIVPEGFREYQVIANTLKMMDEANKDFRAEVRADLKEIKINMVAVNADLGVLKLEISALKAERGKDTARLIAIGATMVAVTIILNIFVVIFMLRSQ